MSKILHIEGGPSLLVSIEKGSSLFPTIHLSPYPFFAYQYKGDLAKTLVDEIFDWLSLYALGSEPKWPFFPPVTGTFFQRSVWEALQTIPFGKTQTYTELAKFIGFPKAARAIGNACNKNPYPLFIPCHRVVGKSDIGGFAFEIEVKKELMKFEQKKGEENSPLK